MVCTDVSLIYHNGYSHCATSQVIWIVLKIAAASVIATTKSQQLLLTSCRCSSPLLGKYSVPILCPSFLSEFAFKG